MKGKHGLEAANRRAAAAEEALRRAKLDLERERFAHAEKLREAREQDRQTQLRVNEIAEQLALSVAKAKVEELADVRLRAQKREIGLQFVTALSLALQAHGLAGVKAEAITMSVMEKANLGIDASYIAGRAAFWATQSRAERRRSGKPSAESVLGNMGELARSRQKDMRALQQSIDDLRTKHEAELDALMRTASESMGVDWRDLEREVQRRGEEG